MTTQPPPDVPEATEGESDPALDTRAQFRAALERKRSRHAAGASGFSGDSKIHDAHGAAGGRRVFRRKSG